MAALKSIPENLAEQRLTFKGGVHPPEGKEISEHIAIERAPIPPQVVLHTSMHVGAPAQPIVAKKDAVVRGQLIAEAAGFVSAPLHSPVCGTVKEITPLPHQSGRMLPAIVITTDQEATAAAIAAQGDRDVPADLDLSSYAATNIIEKVKAAGIVGLGGAAFPSYIKLTPNEKKPIDIVILNGTECEPYLTADHRTMLERPGPIIAGLRLAMKATGAKRGAIGIEENKPDAIAALKQVVTNACISERIDICTMKTKYPQGGERNLIPALTGRAVPVGGFPPDIGVAIFNVGTAAAMTHAVVHDQPLIERVLTLTGPGITHPGNLVVMIGTPLDFLIEHRGGIAAHAGKAILGGPMMGPTASRLNLPVMKGMSGVTIFSEDQIKPRKEYACIRCGRCVDTCPLGLSPVVIARLSQYRRPAEAVKAHLNACVECGCCSYVCPSNIPLVQYIRSGKAQARKIR